MSSRSTAERTLSGTRSNANSGLWTPTIVSPAAAIGGIPRLEVGSVLRQLMHEYVQKSTSTTRPRRAASVRGWPLARVDPRVDALRARVHCGPDVSDVGASAGVVPSTWSSLASSCCADGLSLDSLLQRLGVARGRTSPAARARRARWRSPSSPTIDAGRLPAARCACVAHARACPT